MDPMYTIPRTTVIARLLSGRIRRTQGTRKRKKEKEKEEKNQKKRKRKPKEKRKRHIQYMSK